MLSQFYFSTSGFRNNPKKNKTADTFFKNSLYSVETRYPGGFWGR